MAYGEPQGQAQPHFYSATEMGVRYFCWSLLLFLIWTHIAFGMAVIGSYGPLNNVPYPILAGLFTAVCGALILGLVLIIVGIIQFLHGKNEFPEGNHPCNVIFGTLFFILALAMFIAGIVLLPVLGSSAAIIIAVIIILLPIFFGLMYVLMIKEIAQPADKTLLYGGFILVLVSEILLFALLVAFLPADNDNVNPCPLYMSILFPVFVGLILFFMAYWRTKKALEEGQSPTL